MLVLLSPAKTLKLDRETLPIDHSLPIFLKDASILMERLRQMTPEDISSFMKVSEKIAHQSYERFQAWQTPFTPKNAKAAILAFAGEVYEGLSASEFEEDDLVFAQAHLRILSGLYGILRPLDLIQPYRLEMASTLHTSLGKSLYSFWGDSITEALNESINDEGEAVVVNLASQEYFKAINLKLLKARVITPVFKELKGGKYKIVSFSAKRARGLMSRYIVKNSITIPEDLKSFNAEGYSFDKSLSSADTWVFTRRP